MKIRLMGLPAEINPALMVIQQTKTLEVIQVNGP